MKKALRVIMYCLILLIIALVCIGFMRFGPLLTMKPMNTGVINSNDLDCHILALKFANMNLFIINDDDKFIVIDTGIDANVLSQMLQEQKIEVADVTDVLLTHNHFDHVGGLSVFDNSNVYIGQADSEGVNAKNILKIEDNQIIKTKKHEIKCIAMPGHTKGSFAFLVDGKYLFTGDVAKISGNTFKLHPFTSDKKTAKLTLQKVYNFYQEGISVISTHYGMRKLNK